MSVVLHLTTFTPHQADMDDLKDGKKKNRTSDEMPSELGKNVRLFLQSQDIDRKIDQFAHTGATKVSSAREALPLLYL